MTECCVWWFWYENGVRRGGILALVLFRFYITVVIKLTSIGCGSNIGGIFVNLSCYADDVVLLAPSWIDSINVLQKEAALMILWNSLYDT